MPSLWPKSQRPLLMNFEPSIGHLISAEASEADARRKREAEAAALYDPHVFLTRDGITRTALHKTMRVHRSDGRSPSSLLLMWTLPKDPNDTP